MKRGLLFILSVLCLAELTACNVMRPISVTPEKTYTIMQWPKKINVVPQYATTQKTLLVTTPIAAPGFESSQMIYVEVPYQLKSYANHRWVAPPASLLLQLIANRLSAAHYFKAVVESPFSGMAEFQLNMQLFTLQQEFLQPDSCVRLRIGVTLIRIATGDVLANHIFETTVPSPRNNPYSGVLATNEAATRLSDEIAQFTIKRLS